MLILSNGLHPMMVWIGKMVQVKVNVLLFYYKVLIFFYTKRLPYIGL